MTSPTTTTTTTKAPVIVQSTFSKILAKLTALGNTFSALAPALKFALVTAVLVALYFIFASSHTPNNVDKFNTKYGAYQSSVDSTVKFVKDSMGKKIAENQQTVKVILAKADQQQAYIVKLQKTTLPKDSLVKLERQIDSLKKATTDSVVLARTVIPKQDTLIARQDTTIAKQDTTINDEISQALSLRNIMAKQNNTISLQKTSIDTLTKKLTTLPKAPKPDRILGFIPEPTRKAAFGVGVVVGALIAIEAVIHIK